MILKQALGKNCIEDSYKRAIYVKYCRVFPSNEDFVTIKGQNKAWQVNKNVAIQVNPFFRAILNTAMKERDYSIDLKKLDGSDFSDEALEALVEFINIGNSDFPSEFALEPYELAHQYGMTDLLHAARYKIYHNMDISITISNLSDWWQWAKKYEDLILLLKCTEFYLKNIREYCNQYFDAFKESKIINPLIEILDSKALNFKINPEGVSCEIIYFEAKALYALTPFLKQSVKLLKIPNSKGKLTDWLIPILANPTCSVSTLDVSLCDHSLKAILSNSMTLKKLLA